MVVNLEQVKIGAKNFIDQEICAKAVGKTKFVICFLSPIIVGKIPKYLNSLKEFAPEIFDENGNVELDKFYNMGKEAIKKSGQFEFAGIIFNETDVDRLYSFIKNTGVVI